MIETFNVVPLCDRQLRDVNKNDILNNGLYRKCNVYKSGGGYDRFPAICEKRLGIKANLQFVVQLFGCPFDCPYCYVTRDGVLGKYVQVPSNKLIDDFNASGCEIFHLMGGAPALYIDKWDSIIDKVPIFHSDIMLVENTLNIDVLKKIAKPNALYAVSIKGSTIEEYKKNTNTIVDFDKIKANLFMLRDAGVNFYITFTGLSEESMNRFKDFIGDESLFKDSFNINIVQYNAIKA